MVRSLLCSMLPVSPSEFLQNLVPNPCIGIKVFGEQLKMTAAAPEEVVSVRFQLGEATV
ncbi:MAG: hypothetical protein H6Q38_979 [Chloroflexi bacterium]|nr:hypothetical protein [Chloroflexota bacterium]